MPSIKDLSNAKNFSKVKDLVKVGYNKVYGLLEDDAKISGMFEKTEALLKKFPGGKLDDLADTVRDARIYLLLIRDYMYNEYRDIKMRSIVLVILGTLYTIAPLDLIPDSFGLIGLIDDAAVLKLVHKMIDDEIEQYRDWRKAVGKDPADEEEDSDNED